MNVGIADDSSSFRAVLRRSIEVSETIRVVGEAASLPEAKELLRNENMDVLILDYRFPDGTAIEVLNELAGIQEKPLVLVCTNYMFPKYREKCLALGAAHFYDKTYQFHELLGTLDALHRTNTGRGKGQSKEKRA